MSGFIDIGPRQTGLIAIGPVEPAAGGGGQTVSPATVVHTRSIGNPVLAGPVKVATVVHSRSVPSPAVNPPDMVQPAPVGPHRLILTPTVSGPVDVATVVGPRFIGKPSITESQSITPSAAVIGPRNVPSPRVAFVQVLDIATVVGPRAVGNPTISGGPQYVNVPTVIGPRYVPAPGLSGGRQGVFLYLSNIDRSTLLNVTLSTMSIQSQTLGRWTASIDLYVNNLDYVPQLGESCLVLDNNNRIFAGCITQVVADRFLGTKHSMVFRCTAVDKSGICDHRIVAGATYSKLDEFGQPRDIADTIIRITTSYLNGEGFTLGPEIVRGAFGPQSVDYNWNFPTVTAAFDQICSNEGLVWWVDSYSVLHFSSLTNLPDAPFGLTENSNNWRNLTITRSTTAFSNKLYAVSNISVIPGSAVGSGSTGQQGLVETITWSTTSPNVVIQNGVAVGFKVSVALGTVISLTVNGNTQTVYDFANYSGQTRINSNDYLWEFHAGNNQLSWTYGFSPTGQNIVINYTPFSTQSSSSAQYGTALSPAYGGPLGRCGSGIYEGVVQVDSINDATQLNSIASAMLTRIGGVPTVADFETDYAGLLTGQLIPIDVPWSTCGDGTTAVKLMITAVSGVHMPAGQAPNGSLGTGSNFRWTIQANSNLDPGNYIKWYERLVGRTNNPLPIKKLVPARFILGNGGNLSAGNALGNPYIVNETAQLVELLMAAATPPTGQNLTIEITRAGIVIAAITMLYTQAANTLIYIPLSSDKSPWLFKGDILQFNASYQPLTTNPTPASNVSLTLNTTA